MTGGRVVVLGTTGRNFAASMSGGIAYILDAAHTFTSKVDMEMVELGKVTDPCEIAALRSLIEDHRHYTLSDVADRVSDFHHLLPLFVRVMPLDYKRVLEEQKVDRHDESDRDVVGFYREGDRGAFAQLGPGDADLEGVVGQHLGIELIGLRQVIHGSGTTNVTVNQKLDGGE